MPEFDLTRDEMIEDYMQDGDSREDAEEKADTLIEMQRNLAERGSQMQAGLSTLTQGRFGRVLYSQDLKMLNDDAMRRNYNRALTDEFIARLDPEGTHVVGWTLTHEHAQGKKVDPHMRVQIFAKMRDRGASMEESEEVHLDMTLEHFQALTILYKNDEGEYEVMRPGDPREVMLAQMTGD